MVRSWGFLICLWARCVVGYKLEYPTGPPANGTCDCVLNGQVQVPGNMLFATYGSDCRADRQDPSNCDDACNCATGGNLVCKCFTGFEPQFNCFDNICIAVTSSPTPPTTQAPTVVPTLVPLVAADSGAPTPALGGGPIAGIVLGGLCLWIVICFALVRFYQAKERKELSSQPNPQELPAYKPFDSPSVLVAVPEKRVFEEESNDARLRRLSSELSLTPVESFVTIENMIHDMVRSGELRELKKTDILKIDRIAGEGAFKVVLACQISEGSASQMAALSVLKLKMEAHFSPTAKDEVRTQLKEDFLNEVRYNIKLRRHPNVIGIKGVCFDSLSEEIGEMAPHLIKGNSELYNMAFVFELAKGSIYSLIYEQGVEFSLPQKQHMLHGIIMGIAHLHANAVIHRDLKTANVLVSLTDVCLLSDFGTAKQSTFRADSMMSTMHQGVGTLRYMAPEQLPKAYQHGFDINVKVSEKADMWAYGLLVYELFTGSPPWNTRGEFEKPRSAKSDWVPPECQLFLRDETQPLLARKIVKACLSFDRDSRPSAPQVELLLREGGWDKSPQSK